MSNMSYCRFHNTRLDLQDCLDAISDDGTISKEEARAGRHLFDDFLSFCRDNGIIESFDAETVDAIFIRMEEDEDDE